jgi:hypothetical protein
MNVITIHMLKSLLSFGPSWYYFFLNWCYFEIRVVVDNAPCCFNVWPLFSSPDVDDHLYTEMIPVFSEHSEHPKRCLGKETTMWPTVAVLKRCNVPTNSNTTTCHSIIMFRQCHMCDIAKWHCNCDFCSSIMTMQVVMQDSYEQNIIMSTGVPVIASCDGGYQLWCAVNRGMSTLWCLQQYYDLASCNAIQLPVKHYNVHRSTRCC